MLRGKEVLLVYKGKGSQEGGSFKVLSQQVEVHIRGNMGKTEGGGGRNEGKALGNVHKKVTTRVKTQGKKGGGHSFSHGRIYEVATSNRKMTGSALSKWGDVTF